MDLVAFCDKMFSALARGGFQPIIDAAYETMRLPVALHDSAFNLLAAAPREKIGDYFWDVCLETGVFPQETIMLFYDQGFMEAANKAREPYYVDWGDCAEKPKIQGVVRVNDVVEGYISIHCPKDICTPDHFKATALLTNACAIEMERNKNRNLSENPLFKVFMHDLIKGKVSTKEELDMWRQRLPASFCGAFQLYAIRTQVPNVKAILKYILDILKSVHSGHIEMINDDMLYLMLYALDSKRTYYLAQDEIERKMETLQARAGISERFDDIMRFHVFREQADAALEMGELLGRDERLFHFRDYRFPFIMNAVSKKIDEENLMAPGIALLEQYDKKYGTSYLDTLERYVLDNRNGKKTMEALAIHRNTLLYRLQKIEELLSISLEDGDTFAHYYISLYIRRAGRLKLSTK